jgi:hypothetical protein
LRRPSSPASSARRLALALGAAVLAVVACGTAAAPADASTAIGTTYSVACRSGKPGGDGSVSRPWTSLAKVAAHGAFSPGDHVLLRRGTTCRGRIAPTGSGTPGAPIVLGAYGKGAEPTIAAGGSRNGTGAVQLTNVSYWSVQDLRITNTTGRWNPTAYRAGLLFRSTSATRQMGLGAQRLVIEKVDSNPGGSGDTRAYGGIAVQTTPKGAGFGGMVVRGNRIVGVGRSGITVFNRAYPRSSDRDLRITGNTVRWARGDSIVISGVDGARIDHNVSAFGSNISTCSVQQCGRMGGPSTANAGIWPTMSSDVRIDHNEVYGEHRSAGDGSGIDVDLGAHRITVEQNYLHDNERGGVMFCGAHDTTVRFNILEHNAESAIWFTCGWAKDQRPKNIAITNNDVVVDASSRWVVRNIHPHPGKDIRFTNNLVFCSGPCVYSWPNRPRAAANTFVGVRSRTEPAGTGTRHAATLLRAPGTGGTGFSSLQGYRWKKGATPGTGVALSGGVHDVFDRPVDVKRPPRGASTR